MAKVVFPGFFSVIPAVFCAECVWLKNAAGGKREEAESKSRNGLNLYKNCVKMKLTDLGVL